jgi:hypothetical protein
LEKELEDQGPGLTELDKETAKMAYVFKAEAEESVKIKCRLLGEIEKV